MESEKDKGTPCTGEGAMPEGQREEWTERLVALLLQDDTPAPLRATAGAALAGPSPQHSSCCCISCNIKSTSGTFCNLKYSLHTPNEHQFLSTLLCPHSHGMLHIYIPCL